MHVKSPNTLAARDGCCGSKINAGVLALQPSISTYLAILDYMNSAAFLALTDTSCEQVSSLHSFFFFAHVLMDFFPCVTHLYDVDAPGCLFSEGSDRSPSTNFQFFLF